jgi:hypothetical protein
MINKTLPKVLESQDMKPAPFRNDQQDQACQT